MSSVNLVRALSLALFAILPAIPQEAKSGFDLRATITAALFDGPQSTETPRDGSPWTGGVRSIFYPTLKINDHWSVSAAVQVHSRPSVVEELHTQGFGVKTDILQGTLNYSRFWRDGSFLLRAGELTTAFGSFLLRYDDANNALIEMPQAYGYYYQPVTTLGLTGVEADASWKKVDLRGQFSTSSPVNRRSAFDRDQYGNWTVGAGYTIRQGFRVGISAFHGPYLDRHYPFYFPGEALPRELPADAFGVDAGWAAGHWDVQGELQRFAMNYRLIPTFHEQAEYVEVRRVLHPRWFIGGRAGYMSTSATPSQLKIEGVVGFRPNARQIVKAGLGSHHTLELQIVTSLHPFTSAWN